MCTAHTQAEPTGVTRSWEAGRKQRSRSGRLESSPEPGLLGVFPNQNSHDTCFRTARAASSHAPGPGEGNGRHFSPGPGHGAPAVDPPFCWGYGGGGYYGLGRDHPTPSELTLLKLPRLRDSFRFLTSRNSRHLYSSPVRWLSYYPYFKVEKTEARNGRAGP